MIRKCSDKDYHVLMRYLQQEPVYHTFIIADITRYGFDKDYQTVYMQEAKEGCCGIFLRYYNNFIVAGDAGAIDYREAGSLVTGGITTVMGRAELVSRICSGLDRDYEYGQKVLYTYEGKAGTANPIEEPTEESIEESPTEELPTEEPPAVRPAGLGDVDRIYDFLMGIPQLRPLYTQKAMIENRIRSGEGIHVIMEKDGKIIAHGNSAASADLTVMLGGIGVSPEYRRKGYASRIMEGLCREIQKGKRTPCIFAGDEASKALCEKAGFVEYGSWGTAQF